MRLVFMGTPDFAVPALEALIRGGHEVAAVVTQPDRPRGRGKAIIMSPVKQKALEHGIAVLQPERIKKDEAFLKSLEEISPDAIVVAAFGQILPETILRLPRYGCINIHASLLPKYRGAAPIQWAVINGEEFSGVTTMQMDAGLDTGDIMETKEVELRVKETGGSLFEKLSEAGGELILSTLRKVEDGSITHTKQAQEESSYAGMLDKAMGRVDWSRGAEEIERLIRGLNPWPSAYTSYKGKTLKFWDADVVVQKEERTAEPGEIVSVEEERFLVQTGNGLLAVYELQLEGKKRMLSDAFLRGYPMKEGEKLV
ncbi:methionyl-tRNA formyltransferase [Clostridiaceae bacterium]|nr:methionyl-tRNA formyltransferase [Clostridiaceae bacterium]